MTQFPLYQLSTLEHTEKVQDSRAGWQGLLCERRRRATRPGGRASALRVRAAWASVSDRNGL
eukprot:6187460-Pleurochrysis_carterae.AAC.1